MMTSMGNNAYEVSNQDCESDGRVWMKAGLLDMQIMQG